MTLSSLSFILDVILLACIAGAFITGALETRAEKFIFAILGLSTVLTIVSYLLK